MPTPAVSARLRHYVTFTPSFILFFVFAFFALEKATIGLVTASLFWGVGCVGPMLELLGKPAGRAVTLWVGGLQAAAILGLFGYIAYDSRGELTVRLFDLPGLIALLLPALLFFWNYRAGKSAAAPVVGS
jgi:hypothetical protein